MLRKAYESIKVGGISERYFPPDKLSQIIKPLARDGQLDLLGSSERGLPIAKYEVGLGPVRIMMWSQMHGNETTTTKAVMDLIQVLSSGLFDSLLRKLRICIIPMLNPDGSQDYTRENANRIDLNRDAMDLSQAESRYLDSCFKQFSPDFCFNLHDQRTIYNTGGLPVPATLSFLSPAKDTVRSSTGNRLRAMKLIAAVAADLKTDLPHGIGRYDDTFNPKCVGDRFQKQGTPTVLFEAGHYPGDYEREETRYYVFRALLAALQLIDTEDYLKYNQGDYEAIPPNTRDFVDLRITNPEVLHPRFKGRSELLIQFREVLRGGRIHFVPDWPAEDLSNGRFGHRNLDASLQADRAEILNDLHLSRLLF